MLEMREQHIEIKSQCSRILLCNSRKKSFIRSGYERKFLYRIMALKKRERAGILLLKPAVVVPAAMEEEARK